MMMNDHSCSPHWLWCDQWMKLEMEGGVGDGWVVRRYCPLDTRRIETSLMMMMMMVVVLTKMKMKEEVAAGWCQQLLWLLLLLLMKINYSSRVSRGIVDGYGHGHHGGDSPGMKRVEILLLLLVVVMAQLFGDLRFVKKCFDDLRGLRFADKFFRGNGC